MGSWLLAIAREQIHVIVIAFVNLEDKQNSPCKLNPPQALLFLLLVIMFAACM